MAASEETRKSDEELSPLLAGESVNVAEKAKPSKAEKVPLTGDWTAEGTPLGIGSVVGEPIRRSQWDTGLLACLGRNDDFCSSDIEVCLLGTFAPCVLYGSNVERLDSNPGTFGNNCLPYSGLYLVGNLFFGGNILAPWFSYPTRSAIRRKFNLEGSCEGIERQCGCIVKEEWEREQCETACDFGTHIFCHACALCQEARQLRRTLPHPALPMLPPLHHSMTRHP